MAKVEQKTVPLNGDESVAYAVKQCDVDVLAAYPITPQTIIVEKSDPKAFLRFISENNPNVEINK